jgi:DNA-binding CsgD family transcriptional regulator
VLEPIPKHWKAKGDLETAREIRRLFAAGMTRRQLAERFGYTYEGVRQIIRRRVWKGA